MRESHLPCVAGGVLTDLLSFYTLPSSVIGNDKYDELKAAFMYYTVATATPLQVRGPTWLCFPCDCG